MVLRMKHSLKNGPRDEAANGTPGKAIFDDPAAKSRGLEHRTVETVAADA
jgi:hypothetical protein